MSVLGLYSHMWWDAPDIDDEDDLDDATCPPEILTDGWWSASSDLDDDE